MNINKLTQKSVTAVQEAQSIAIKKGSSQVDQQHLMSALLEQELISQLITRMGKDREAFSAALEKEINRLPRMSGGREMDRVYITSELDRALNSAEQQILPSNIRHVPYGNHLH